MSKAVYLAGDFSGIQRFVLGVESAGSAQAKRLRARSFLLELFEHAALWTIAKRLRLTDDDILVRGGGFLVRIPRDTDSVWVEGIHADLQRKVWNESGGEVQFSVGWGETPHAARGRLEFQKHCAGTAICRLERGNSTR